MLIRAKKKFFLQKCNMGTKNVEFHADFKSIDKVLKNVPKKVISKNVTEICTFSTFNFDFFKKPFFGSY
jgi:hypothetical protein